MSPVTTERVEASEVARHIARSAARLFSSRGYDATSVREIVEAAGVTKPTLYYHFGSKEGLAQALLKPLTSLGETLQRIAGSEGEPTSILVRLFEAHFAFCREEPDRARFYYAIAFGPHAEGLSEQLMKFGCQLDAPIVAVAERMASAEIILGSRGDDLRFVCRALITSAVMEFLFKGIDLGPDLSSRLVNDLLRGFGEPGSESRGLRS